MTSRSLWIWLKMNTEATSVLNGMLPEIRTSEPNSPIERAKASAIPERIAGRRFGRMIRRKVVSGPAPSEAAASSMSVSSSISTGCTERITNGRVTNSSAMTTPIRVNATPESPRTPLSP